MIEPSFHQNITDKSQAQRQRTYAPADYVGAMPKGAQIANSGSLGRLEDALANLAAAIDAQIGANYHLLSALGLSRPPTGINTEAQVMPTPSRIDISVDNVNAMIAQVNDLTRETRDITGHLNG